MSLFLATYAVHFLSGFWNDFSLHRKSFATVVADHVLHFLKSHCWDLNMRIWTSFACLFSSSIYGMIVSKIITFDPCLWGFTICSFLRQGCFNFHSTVPCSSPRTVQNSYALWLNFPQIKLKSDSMFLPRGGCTEETACLEMAVRHLLNLRAGPRYALIRLRVHW